MNTTLKEGGGGGEVQGCTCMCYLGEMCDFSVVSMKCFNEF